jgi:hypothetical protein
MWALVEDNNITKIFNRPKAFRLGDNQYSSSVFTLWSIEEKEAIGLYEVVIDNTNLKDEKYYINGSESFTFADGVATKSFAIATAKTLDDVTDEDGNVTRGLKYNHKEVINQQAAGLLQPTDWYVLRATDGGTAVPANISTYRSSIRTKANEMCDLIDAAADVDALSVLYEYTNTGTEESPIFTRPLGEWPIL